MVKAGIVGFLPEDKSDVWEFFNGVLIWDTKQLIWIYRMPPPEKT